MDTAEFSLFKGLASSFLLASLVARTNNCSYKLHVQSESWKYMYVKRYRSSTDDMNKSCAINVDSISKPVTLKQINRCVFTLDSMM